MKLFKWYKLDEGDYANYMYPFRESVKRVQCLFMSLIIKGRGTSIVSKTSYNISELIRLFDDPAESYVSHLYIELIFKGNYRGENM
jgi:hypothetical protein